MVHSIFKNRVVHKMWMIQRLIHRTRYRSRRKIEP